MKVSIVTTLYCSEKFIDEFYKRIKSQVDLLALDYEIIFVNDGSPDNSLKYAVELQQQDEKIIVVDLSRNFGHHKAMMAGLSHATGEKIFLIDSDLEEPPELLTEFHKLMLEQNCDVIYGVQKQRKGNWFERISGDLYYKTFNYITKIDFPKNIVTVRLMTARYVKSLLLHQERELNMAGLWYITGYNQIPCYINKSNKGSSHYNMRRKLSIVVNAITSFSNRPLRYIFYTGSFILILSTLYISILIFRKIFYHQTIDGWTSLIVSIWFLGGLTIFFLGIIGIYLSKIFIEIKQRPYTIVREVYSKKSLEDKHIQPAHIDKTEKIL